jgi:hypothetical protein
MAHLSGIARHWLGLCRKPPLVRTLPIVTSNPPEAACDGRPDGGGTGTIRRGVGSAVSGMKTLIHNPQLLWFSLLIGLVLAGHIFAQWVLYTHSYSVQELLIGDSPFAYVLSSFLLTFVVEIPTVFCLVFLLAGLTLSLSPENGSRVSFFHGLARAKKYVRPLTGWSVVVALAGTLLFIAGQNSYLLSTWFPPFSMIPTLWSALWDFLYNVLGQSPFNYVFYHPDFYLLPPGEAWGIEWVFKYVLTQTLILSAINMLLFVLTWFVIPLLVLERMSLMDAVSGSFGRMKKIWGEVVACAFSLGMVLFMVSLTYLIFPEVTGILARDITWRAGDAWIAAGSLYMLALAGFAFIIATVGGIAALYLYTSVKTGQMPESAGTGPVL